MPFPEPGRAGIQLECDSQFSLNRNKIIDLYPGVTLYDIKTLDAIQIMAAQGSYYGDIYGQTFLRVTDKDSPHYGKVIVGDDGLPLISAEKSKVGNQSPDWMLGLTNSFSYKGFNLSSWSISVSVATSIRQQLPTYLSVVMQPERL